MQPLMPGNSGTFSEDKSAGWTPLGGETPILKELLVLMG